MKTLIAYGLVAIRIPNLVGLLFATVVSVPISIVVWLFRRDKKSPRDASMVATQEAQSWAHRSRIEMAVGDRIAHACHDILAGLGSVLAAVLLFRICNVPLSLWVLLIFVIWEVIFMISCRQSLRVLIGTLAGMFFGWFALLPLFAS